MSPSSWSAAMSRAATNLNLTANTPATFTYSGDPTTLSSVRVTFNGNVVASAKAAPIESCFEPPSVTLTPRCTNEGLALASHRQPDRTATWRR
jgi:hypothetical protein